MKNVLVAAVLMFTSALLFAQTTQPTERPGVKDVEINKPTITPPKVNVPATQGKPTITPPKVNVPTPPGKPVPGKPTMTAPAKPEMDTPAKPKMDAPDKPKMDAPDKPKMKAPAKPKMEKPAKPKMPKMPKMQTPKLPGADILKGAGIDLGKALKGMGLSEKETKVISGKNMDLLSKVTNIAKDGKLDWKKALKEVKGLNKTNLKDIKGMLTKDQLKQYKPVAKKIWVAVKDFLLKALKK